MDKDFVKKARFALTFMALVIFMFVIFTIAITLSVMTVIIITMAVIIAFALIFCKNYTDETFKIITLYLFGSTFVFLMFIVLGNKEAAFKTLILGAAPALFFVAAFLSIFLIIAPIMDKIDAYKAKKYKRAEG